MYMFDCVECGYSISSNMKPDPDKPTCALCNWINSNTNLTPEEKVALRKRMRGEYDAARNRGIK